MNKIENINLTRDISCDSLDAIIAAARGYRRSRPVCYDSLFQVQLELRKQRKKMLGTGVPFSVFLYSSENILHSGVVDLTKYLSNLTLALWKKPEGNHFSFCHQFYEMCFACPSWVTLDDIVLIATTLVHRERNVFLYLMEDLLPINYHELLHSFAFDFPDSFYSAAFEDAVLGAILILLGTIKEISAEEAK